MDNEQRKKLVCSQWELCLDHDWPMFAPANGFCPSCNSDIVDESWSERLVTSCKYCHKSFCE